MALISKNPKRRLTGWLVGIGALLVGVILLKSFHNGRIVFSDIELYAVITVCCVVGLFGFVDFVRYRSVRIVKKLNASGITAYLCAVSRQGNSTFRVLSIDSEGLSLWKNKSKPYEVFLWADLKLKLAPVSVNLETKFDGFIVANDFAGEMILLYDYRDGLISKPIQGADLQAITDDWLKRYQGNDITAVDLSSENNSVAPVLQ